MLETNEYGAGKEKEAFPSEKVARNSNRLNFHAIKTRDTMVWVYQ